MLRTNQFEQRVFHDAVTGDELPYNLFVPEVHDADESLPLVVFMHDSGVLDTDPRATLLQGDGATRWASASDQKARPAFVLAPQYSAKVVDDWHSHVVTSMLDTTIRLVESLLAEYPIDRSRVYATGQSMGGMMAIVMGSRRPDLFAALYLVACQWDASVVLALVHTPLWILVSEGDLKAFPGQQMIVEALRSVGATVHEARWHAREAAPGLESAARAMASSEAQVKFAVFERQGLFTQGVTADSGAHHVETWRFAYSIEPIREWMFSQRLV